MKKPINPVLALVTLSVVLVNLVSCTVAANKPPLRMEKTAMSKKYQSILLENADFKIVNKADGRSYWFDGKVFREKALEHVRASGMPDRVLLPIFESGYVENYPLRYQMEKEEKKYAFFMSGLVFNKRTVLRVAQGAFILKLKSPSGEVVALKDRGMVMKSGPKGKRSYLDSGKSIINVHWGLQKVDPTKSPTIVYFRLPVQYKGWDVESISADLEMVEVASK